MKTPLGVFWALALAVWAGGSAADAAQDYYTQHALVEINDPRADQNPVKSVPAAQWRAVDVHSKVRPKPHQRISIVCEGAFPGGYIAEDLWGPDGQFHRNFSVNSQTTVMDLCHQQEDRQRRVHRRLLK